jgi:TatA/E family protein of Tat protein translocase
VFAPNLEWRSPGRRAAILAAEGRVFGTIGMPELILIFAVALLLFGPRKMPQIGRSIGRALGEFRRASNDFKRTIEDEVAADEIRDVERDLKEIRQVGQDVVKGVDPRILDDTSDHSADENTKERDST